jgi:hypothetical protein
VDAAGRTLMKQVENACLTNSLAAFSRGRQIAQPAKCLL